jgi:hypothetical protein
MGEPAKWSGDPLMPSSSASRVTFLTVQPISIHPDDVDFEDVHAIRELSQSGVDLLKKSYEQHGVVLSSSCPIVQLKKGYHVQTVLSDLKEGIRPGKVFRIIEGRHRLNAWKQLFEGQFRRDFPAMTKTLRPLVVNVLPADVSDEDLFQIAARSNVVTQGCFVPQTLADRLKQCDIVIEHANRLSTKPTTQMYANMFVELGFYQSAPSKTTVSQYLSLRNALTLEMRQRIREDSGKNLERAKFTKNNVWFPALWQGTTEHGKVNSRLQTHFLDHLQQSSCPLPATAAETYLKKKVLPRNSMLIALNKYRIAAGDRGQAVKWTEWETKVIEGRFDKGGLLEIETALAEHVYGGEDQDSERPSDEPRFQAIETEKLKVTMHHDLDELRSALRQRPVSTTRTNFIICSFLREAPHEDKVASPSSTGSSYEQISLLTGMPRAVALFAMNWRREKGATEILEKVVAARKSPMEMHRYLLLRSMHGHQCQEYVSLHIACEPGILEAASTLAHSLVNVDAAAKDEFPKEFQKWMAELSMQSTALVLKDLLATDNNVLVDPCDALGSTAAVALALGVEYIGTTETESERQFAESRVIHLRTALADRREKERRKEAKLKLLHAGCQDANLSEAEDMFETSHSFAGAQGPGQENQVEEIASYSSNVLDPEMLQGKHNLETRTRPDENAEEPGEEEDPLETLDSISELIRSELAQEKLEQEDFDRLTAGKFVRNSTAILNKPDVPQGATSADDCPQENTAKENHANATNTVEQSIVQKKRRWKGDPVLRNLHQPTAARAEEEDAGGTRRSKRRKIEDEFS